MRASGFPSTRGYAMASLWDKPPQSEGRPKPDVIGEADRLVAGAPPQNESRPNEGAAFRGVRRASLFLRWNDPGQVLRVALAGLSAGRAPGSPERAVQLRRILSPTGRAVNRARGAAVNRMRPFE